VTLGDSTAIGGGHPPPISLLLHRSVAAGVLESIHEFWLFAPVFRPAEPRPRKRPRLRNDNAPVHDAHRAYPHGRASIHANKAPCALKVAEILLEITELLRSEGWFTMPKPPKAAATSPKAAQGA
jgi:hypothetical protein